MAGCLFGHRSQKTVIGLPQARAYCKWAGCKFRTTPSRNQPRFGVDCQQSLGILSIRLPTHDSFLVINVDVVPVDVPFLVGLDVLDAFGLTVDTVENTLKAPKSGWSIPLVRKLGHVYLEWQPKDRILYTRSELTKLHRGFFHPTSKRLLELIKRAKLEDLDANGKRILEETAASCKTCQFLGPKPLRF
jgi:hypothetical protein